MAAWWNLQQKEWRSHPDWWALYVGVGLSAGVMAVFLGWRADWNWDPHPVQDSGHTVVPVEWLLPQTESDDGSDIQLRADAFIVMAVLVGCVCGVARMVLMWFKWTRLAGPLRSRWCRVHACLAPDDASAFQRWGVRFMGRYAVGYAVMAAMTLASLVLGQVPSLKSVGIETTIWAFLMGLLVSNVVVPFGIRPLVHWHLRTHHSGGDADPWASLSADREDIDDGVWKEEEDEVLSAGTDLKARDPLLSLSRETLSDRVPLASQKVDDTLEWITAWWMWASDGEWYIKVGLVLLGLDMQTIGSLGGPGILCSWVDTPIIIALSYWFGVRVLHMQDHGLVMLISASLAVCGSSAATAMMSVVGAKEETLVFVIALVTLMTSIQMVVLPFAIRPLHLPDRVVGAWFGGAIDQTGSVVVAAELYGGQEVVETAGLVKIIQNTLIGLLAMITAVYWAQCEDSPDKDTDLVPILPPAGQGASTRPRFKWVDLWFKFPKFVLGFLLVSVALTVARSLAPEHAFLLVKDCVLAMSRWCFTLGFVATGLETRLDRLLGSVSRVRNALGLYVFGQSLDLLIGLGMSYLAFAVL